MEYVSIKEAIELTGRSDKTIRNLIQKAPKAHIKKERKLLLVSKEYLLSQYPPIGNLADNELVKMLKERVDSLEKKLDQAHQEKLQIIQLLRLEQIKALPENEKQPIIKCLTGEDS